MISSIESLLKTFSPFGVLHLCASVYFLVSSVYTLIKYRDSGVFRLYALAAFFFAVKHAAESINVSTLSANAHLVGAHIIFAFLYLAPPLLLRLLQSLTLQSHSKLSLIFLSTLSAGFAIGQLYAPDSFFVYAVATRGLNLLPPGFILFGYFLAALLYLMMLVQRSSQSLVQEAQRGRGRYALMALFFFALYTLRPFNHPVYSVGSDILGLLTLFYLGSHRYLWTFKELGRKTLFWFIASSIPIAPISLLNYLLLSDYVDLPIGFTIGTIVFFYYLLFFYFRQYQHQIDRYFRRVPREFRDHLDQYKSNLILMLSVSGLILKLKELIAGLFAVTHFDVLVWNEQFGAFIPYGMKEPPPHLQFRVYDEMFLWLGEQENIFSKQDFELGDHPLALKNSAADFFRRTESELIVPFALNRSLLALMFLGRKIDGGRFSKSEIYFLTEIRNVTSIAFSNSYLYERISALNETLEEKVKSRTRDLEDAQSQLVHSEKLASLGVMVAGIAHEINTPAGVINGAISNIIDNLNDFLNSALSGTEESFEQLVMQLVNHRRFSNLDASEKYRKTKELQKSLINSFGLESEQAQHRADFLLTYNSEELQQEIASLRHEEFQVLQKVTYLSQNIQNIRIAIEAIVRIVKALKYYSHINQSETESVYLREGIENTLVILHNQLKHGIKVERNFADVEPVTCVVGELNQIWTNLITNAIQAMNGQGEINILLQEVYLSSAPEVTTLSEPDLQPLLVQDLPAKKYQRITIEDSGPGIPSENLDKIFDPFFTTKAPGEGTGLGLGIVKNIVQKHNGFMTVASQPGQTRFAIYLPADAQAIS